MRNVHIPINKPPRYILSGCLSSDVDRNLTLDGLVEGYQSLCRVNPGDGLDLVAEQLHQLVVVLGIHLDEDVVLTSGAVAFHYFRNLLYFLNHLLV